MNPSFELHSFDTADALAFACANAWLDEIHAAANTGTPYCVALSGGRIARNLFTATVAQATARQVRLDDVQFFWADERCVPPADPESNYRLAHEQLLAPLHIGPSHIHRLRGEVAPLQAVQEAEAALRRIARKNAAAEPVLDLVLLGMGEDGHIASLFPDASAKIMDNTAPFLVVEQAPKPPPTRISLSYHAIITAKNVWILVAGPGKAPALREALASTSQSPLARVLARRTVRIFAEINEF